jgi:hypothetical protein
VGELRKYRGKSAEYSDETRVQTDRLVIIARDRAYVERTRTHTDTERHYYYGYPCRRSNPYEVPFIIVMFIAFLIFCAVMNSGPR